MKRLTLMAAVGVLLFGCYDWSIDPVGDADGDADGDSDGDACECSQGPCCDGCRFRGIETRCDDEPVSDDELSCASDECGADVMQRGIYRHCSGVDAECPSNTLREGDWEVFQDCSADQTCVFAGGAATCHSCVESCVDGHCTEPQCETGPCCDDGHFVSSTTGCGDEPEASECRCTSGECGADVECRSQHRLCTGLSAECTTDHLEWEGWATTDECSTDQTCEVTGGIGECLDCEMGCELGACVERECTTGQCCDDGFFRPASHVCSTESEYRCDGTDCGADAQEREVTRNCTGSSSDCDGAVTNGSWTTVEACTTDQVCVATSTDASCRDCDEGCEEGACIGSECTFRCQEGCGDSLCCSPGACASSQAIAAGDLHTCALLDSGAVRCWGSGENGRLGYGDTNYIGDNELPSTAGDVSVGGTVVQIAAGGLHTCALIDSGAVRCWGSGGRGALGYGNTNTIGDNELPSTAGDVPYR